MASDSHSESYYIKTWALLLVLLAVSLIGPELGIKIVTLITAFGIAVVKAYIVAARFMHLNIEKKYVIYLLITGIAMMVLMFFGVAPDVMKHEGQNWEHFTAKEYVEEALAAEPAAHHGDDHGDDHGGDHH